MNKLLVLCGAVLMLAACSKNKFKTEPQIEIKSFGPDVVTRGNFFSLKAVVRDKEGDLQDSLIIYKKRFDTANVLLTFDSIKVYDLSVLKFQNSSEIEINLLTYYGQGLPDPSFDIYNPETKNTYLAFGLKIRDKAGHKSTYVETNKILLKKP